MVLLKRVWAVMCLSVLCLSSFANAWALRPGNLYTDTTDDGNTNDVNIVGEGEGQQDSFVNVVKWTINRILGILAFIALLILLYGWFLMVTSAGDEEKYKKWFTILRHAAIWLILIGVAWFIVSIIFRLTNLITTSWQWGAWTEW